MCKLTEFWDTVGEKTPMHWICIIQEAPCPEKRVFDTIEVFQYNYRDCSFVFVYFGSYSSL